VFLSLYVFILVYCLCTIVVFLNSVICVPLCFIVFCVYNLRVIVCEFVFVLYYTWFILHCVCMILEFLVYFVFVAILFFLLYKLMQMYKIMQNNTVAIQRCQQKSQNTNTTCTE